MGTGTNIDTKVNSAEQNCASAVPVHVVGIQNCCSCVSGTGIVLCIGRIPFYNQFQNTISIHITYRHIVCRIVCRGSIRHRLVCRLLQLKFQILIIPCADTLCRQPGTAVIRTYYLKGGTRRYIRQYHIGYCHILRIRYRSIIYIYRKGCL